MVLSYWEKKQQLNELFDLLFLALVFDDEGDELEMMMLFADEDEDLPVFLFDDGNDDDLVFRLIQEIRNLMHSSGC
jgi:hypothetical protein